MQHFTKFRYNFSDDFYNMKKGKKIMRTYTASSMSLDIETTNSNINGDRIAWCYIWQVAIDGVAYYGRYLSELKTFLNNINSVLKARNRFILCYIHNLPFEFSFLKSYLDFTEVFARKINKPMKASYKRIEFRDSLVYSNMSLETLAKNYTQTKKLVGDLDYSKIRYPWDELTSQEMAYCENDVIILNEFFEQSIYPDYILGRELNCKVPLTNTSKVRMEVKKNIKNMEKLHQILLTLNPTDEIQNMLDFAFKGADVHANINNVDKLLKNISSYDYTSDYIYILFLPIYPVAPIRKINIDDRNKYSSDKYIKFYHIHIKNIQSTKSHHIISISHSQHIPLHGVYDNGRIVSADLIELYVTEYDLEMIKEYYTGTIIYDEIYISRKGYLPNYILNTAVDFYKLKKELKEKLKNDSLPDDEKSNLTKLYMNSKKMLNSMYGMMCTRKGQKVTYKKGEWTVKSQPQNLLGKQDFVLFQWGVLVTSYARYRLEKTILMLLENDFVYCDTDSIKFKHYEKNKHIFENLNKIIDKNIQKTCKDKNLPYDILKGIGEWDFEGTYSKFKTLGAKRYIYTSSDGKVHSTVSGIKKDALNEIAKKRGVDVYEMFNSKGMILSKEEYSKLSALYVDLDEWYLVGHSPDGEPFRVKSFCHLQESGYEMNLNKDYKELIRLYLNSFDYQLGGI